MDTQIAQIITAVIGSSGISSIILYLLQRKDGVRKDIKVLEDKLDRLSNRIDEHEEKRQRDKAEQARLQILRFDDELLNNVKHSKEYYHQILKAIDLYDKFCKRNPDFPNSQAVFAEKHVKESYEQCLVKNDFL
ncbi:hypothetical protein [Lachnobacterium bovis]|uniref:hypothetical protein n=1 Tax=Lachnobacterium bovis TaxID=140626 RepID=UPI000489DCFE|nr:hypothetical protein [Lachnobacterium bovis]SFG64908.1 hypothetical protein SAMN04487761_13415 [Lachnospiraceae bacterium C7]